MVAEVFARCCSLVRVSGGTSILGFLSSLQRFLAPNGSIVAVALALMWVGRVSMASSVAIHVAGMPTTPVVVFGVSRDAYAS